MRNLLILFVMTVGFVNAQNKSDFPHLSDEAFEHMLEQVGKMKSYTGEEGIKSYIDNFKEKDYIWYVETVNNMYKRRRQEKAAIEEAKRRKEEEARLAEYWRNRSKIEFVDSWFGDDYYGVYWSDCADCKWELVAKERSLNKARQAQNYFNRRKQ